ncbi:hypothetical protein DM860_002484 [Cuscuta australis]|uniref:BHLH domain-containing protein n=1 Tax=Cuscuta australis TaxID=267555 RepID=A0A328CZ69_9ASTE|nr:hypothetical protein DM860_002484 [Cuscuta australis]
MDKQENFKASLPTSYGYSLDQMSTKSTSLLDCQPSSSMVNARLPPPPLASAFCSSGGGDAASLSFADVMQFADFGPRLTLNETARVLDQEEAELDPAYFLKYPVLGEKGQEEEGGRASGEDDGGTEMRFLEENDQLEESPLMPLRNEAAVRGGGGGGNNGKGKRKRVRVKSSEEVESQRMTHIAVERNRRKQMNEHLRVLRSLMPTSYVQRGDQASIVGGAIEFVRELEQLLQCLESQKRRRLYGDAPGLPGGSSAAPPRILPPIPDGYGAVAGICEEVAGSKPGAAEVEVKLLGCEGMIKILCRKREGQLVKVISALEQDLHLNIFHTNVTTVDQTVLYSFNVKVSSETRYAAEDLANSVQQIFTFINATS